MILSQEEKIKKEINNLLKNNKKFLKDYKNGKKGTIGFFMDEIIEKSDYSFLTKKSKQELSFLLKESLK
jgi:Asp-tRNA(Asn)/Glu-tRNA(Gln) amidotransferase B subunit